MKIQIHKLKKSFSTKVAVDIDSLEIPDNTLLGVVGNNGAGKTTLFRLMLDLLKPDEGEVHLTFRMKDESTYGTNVNVDEEWKKYTGAFIDESFLIDYLSPEEYFEFIAKISNITKEELSEHLQRFDAFMNGEIIGQNKLIRSMSAGNKQKIGIISSLIHSPQLVILDEPFNFLDPTSQNILKKLLVDYNNETGASILISSHNLMHTVDISNKIVLMEHGRIIRYITENDENTRNELEQYFNKD